MKASATMTGFMQTMASSHPLQTRLSLILTDFEPNSNKQGIPKTEAENIIRTALYTPLKINFDGEEYHGHTGAYPIGPIINAQASTYNGRDVISGEAIIWNDVYDDVSEYLKQAFAEGVGTSWEIYYEDTEDDNGTQWLKGCIFAGTCVVDTPAYGPERTRLLAIAEKLHNRAENNMSKELEIADTTSVNEVETLRTDISGVMDMLSNIYSGLYEMLDSSYEIEQQLAVTDMPAMSEQLTKLLSSIQKRFNDLTSQAASAEVYKTELSELKDKIAQAEELNRKNALETARKDKLTELGIEFSEEKKEFYLSMSEEMFTMYVSDLTSVKSKKATSETKPVIPEPITGSTGEVISIKELAAILRGS